MTLIVKGDQLKAGDKLRPGEALLSPNKRYLLTLQEDDGNLVLYHLPTNDGTRLDDRSQPLWASGTKKDRNDAAFTRDLDMQAPDGHLVLYGRNGSAVWGSGKFGSDNANSYAALQNDGNLVVYRPNGYSSWQTGGWQAHWMEALPGHLTLRDICVPGSHDAGMYYTKLLVRDDIALTQQLTVYEQLRQGSRYFDLRPQHINGKGFYLYHGMADGPKLENVMNDIGFFVRQGTQETVLLEFSHWDNMDNHQTEFVDLLLRSLPDSCLLTQGELNKARDRQLKASGQPVDPKAAPAPLDLKSLTLDELRGKVIILINHDDMYKNIVVGKGKQGIYHRGESIYDSYSDKQDYNSMLQNQAAKFEDFGRPGGDNHPLFMLNWTLTPRNADGYRSKSEIGLSTFAAHLPVVGPIATISTLIWGEKKVKETIDDAGRNIKALVLSEAVKTYANDINPRLRGAAESNELGLFGRNAYGRMVNIINLDYVETANAVPVCLEVMRRVHPTLKF